MKHLYVYILIGLFLSGCQETSKNSSVYIGGEIINPKSDRVVLMHQDKVIDSIPLEENNTFGAKLQGIKPDLYYFKHGNEFQYLYLEPKDSIHLRLNTWDFDETLVFEGIGAEKNELLLKLFLVNEKEESIFYSYFSLPEKAFQNKIDEIYKRHNDLFTTFTESEQSLSKQYTHLVEAAIKYPLLRLKELYPYYHRKTLGMDSTVVISKDFYKYRKKINLNDSFLSEYYAYQNFITAHLYNLAYEKNEGKGFDKNFRKILLKLIAKKIKTPELKNRLLQKEVVNLFFNKPTYLDTAYLKIFNKNCTDSLIINDFKQLQKARESLPLNSTFPNFKIKSGVEEIKNIKDIILNKNAVVYFWSSNNTSHDYLAKRVHFLSEKYPQMIFVGLNFNTTYNSESCFIKKLKNQYYLTPDSKGRSLVSKNHTRAVLVDANGNITNSFARLTSSKIEKQIKELLKH